MAEKLVKRSDKISFMKIDNTFVRMTKFTDLSLSKNSTEYNRHYIDEEAETTDVTGYAESISYSFDQHTDNSVHARLAEVADKELTGTDATVEILTVDKSNGSSSAGYNARLRTYSVIPDSEGNSTDAYTYSGNFKGKGGFAEKTVTLNDDETEATIKTSI